MSHYELHLQRAHEFFEDGNYEAARAAAEQACTCVSADKGDEARLVLALCYQKLEYSEEAYKLLGEVVERTPTAESCAEFALMCAERGECDEKCRAYAHQAIELDPDIANAYLALFFCDVADDLRKDALVSLRRSVNRGANVSEMKAFELVRGWCQEECNKENRKFAYELSGEIVDTFSNTDFFLLHARLAEVCNEPRVAVQYYKYALNQLPAGNMRLEVLEAIAHIAI